MDDMVEKRRFWDRIDQVPADELWEAHQRQKLELAHLRPRPPAQPVRPPRRVADDARGARGGPRPVDPHDRLRPPVRDLQARRACCSPTSSAWRAMLWDEERPRPDHLRRQGAPRRPARPGRDPGHLRPVAQPAAPGPRVHHGGLRHPDRPVPRPGRRRVAQQPAPPARGLGHVRHEGVRQRHPQPLGPRRLVGRGLDGRQRLGDRRPGHEPRRGRPGLGGRAGPVPDPRAGARSPPTTTARTACPSAGSS